MSLWSKAATVAAQTPPARNRLVDFLRAASILAVISGHWLLAAPFIGADGFVVRNMMEEVSFTAWLSWAFQVMPIFFLVGGYANGVSWRATMRDARSYSTWLAARLRRLLVPVLPLIAAWALLAVMARAVGVSPDLVQQASTIALIPIWFLAIYTTIVLFVPWAHAAWQRWGFVSFLVPAALAVLDDVLFFHGFPVLGWLNYLFLWLAVHQLGFAWLDNRVPAPGARLAWGGLGLALLVALTVLGPYPVAMISDPESAISNTLPPKLPLLALAMAQAGFVLAAEAALRRWLTRPVPWTGAVLLNGMIMAIYLWHSTALVLVMALAVTAGDIGLGVEPATGAWWLLRPVWLLTYALALAALMPLVARFERLPPTTETMPAWRQVAGVLLTCAGLALLASQGLGGPLPVVVQAAATLAPFAGALVGGLLPARRPAG